MTTSDEFTNPIADSKPIKQSNLEELLSLQTKVLGSTVTSKNSKELLDQVCLFAEKLTHEALASIMLFDSEKDKDKLYVYTAPSIPEEAIHDLNGLAVGDGSCGNAVFHNEAMFVCNTLTDNRWKNVRSFAEKFKIHACWSSPIQNSAGEAVGSFAMSSFATREPDNFQRLLLSSCASITSIIIQRENALKISLANQNKLLDSQQQYQSLINNSADGIYLIDNEGKIVDINQTVCDTLGYSRDELLSMSIPDIDIDTKPFKTFPEFFNNLKINQTYTIHSINQKKDGTQFPVEVRIRRFISNNEALIVALTRDVSTRKREEEELLKAQKLKSIGFLAGGIAHDFNNILGVIQGYIDLATYSQDSPEKVKTYLEKAKTASTQAASLTQQLLTFSKGGEPVRQAEEIGKIIQQSTEFNLLGSNVNVTYKCKSKDKVWPVEIDGGQIAQVVQNLVINARQAMPDGGTLTISCENYTINKTEGSLIFHQEKYVKICIQDSGVGISKETIESIFDPYFTTKQEGSGLGLALSHSIITKHQGNITVSSELGQGTIFTMYLPASETTLLTTKTNITSLESNTNSERILIMDDDTLMREVTEEMLDNLGYEVTQSACGKSAFALYKSAMDANECFDLVIMDLTIPNGIGGKEAIQLIKEIDPNVKALVCSGYSNDPVMANHDDYGFMGKIKKPYTQVKLSEAVNVILNR